MAGSLPGPPEGRSMDHEPDVERIVGSAYDAHATALQRYLTGIIRDPVAAEDLVQDAFLRLTVEVRAGRAPDDIGGWLHRVAYNLAMSRGRRRTVADRHRRDLVTTELARSPESLAVAHEEHATVREALGALGSADRSALVLASLGYDGPEMARSLGRSQGATRTLLCRARAKLRAQMLTLQPG
jgi:RNA polymerase sigma factor (sigma-70 family)